MNTSRARQCQGKRRHRTLRAAKIALARTAEQTGELTLEFYRCPHCDTWHVGHAPRARRRRLYFDRLLQLIARANRKD